MPIEVHVALRLNALKIDPNCGACDVARDRDMPAVPSGYEWKVAVATVGVAREILLHLVVVRQVHYPPRVIGRAGLASRQAAR